MTYSGEVHLVFIAKRGPGFLGDIAIDDVTVTTSCANRKFYPWHYNDVMMSAMASQITSRTIVYWAVYWGADQRKLDHSASLAFVRGISTGDRWIPCTNGQWRGKCFHLMTSSWNNVIMVSNRCGPASGMFQEEMVNAMAVDAMAPCIVSSSAVMVLSVQDKQVLFLVEGCQVRVLKMKIKCKYMLCFLKQIQHDKG